MTTIQQCFETTINNSFNNGRLLNILKTQSDMNIESVAQYIFNQFIKVEPAVNTDYNFDFIMDKLLILQGQAV